MKVTVKNGKLVIKAKKKAKAGKTYKVVIKYKKGKKDSQKDGQNHSEVNSV